MTKRSITAVASTAFVAAALALVLAGCAGGGGATGEATTTTTPATTAAATPIATPADTPAPTGGASADPAGSGCAATPGSTMPTGIESDSREIGDVDADGRPDTEWIVETDAGTVFGITTASGATFSHDVTSASPAGRHAITARLGSGRWIALVTDGRQTTLLTVVDCALQVPTDAQGAPYLFDAQDLRGNGTGVGCAAAPSGAGLVLAGLEATGQDGSIEVAQTVIDLSADGLTASNGATTTIATGLSMNDPESATARTISCGDATIDSAGVSLANR